MVELSDGDEARDLPEDEGEERAPGAPVASDVDNLHTDPVAVAHTFTLRNPPSSASSKARTRSHVGESGAVCGGIGYENHVNGWIGSTASRPNRPRARVRASGSGVARFSPRGATVQPVGERDDVLRGRRTTPAIVLGSHVTALGVIRLLARNGIGSYTLDGRGDLVSRSRWYRPLGDKLEESRDPAALASFLEGLPFERAVLIPCNDTWARAVAALPQAARERFPSSVAPPAVLERLVDKARFAETLRELGVPHPRTYVLGDVSDLSRVSDAEISRFFLKPRDSERFNARYNRKAFPVGDRAEAEARFRQATADGFELLIQEYVRGPPDRHVFLDGFVDRDGRLCALFGRRRLQMFPHDFGNSTATVSVPVADIAPAATSVRRLVGGLGYRGMFSAEFKLDETDGEFRILEMNARAWWFVGFAGACGVDMPLLAYRDALGLSVEPVTRYDIGKLCVYPKQHVRAGWHAWRHGEPRVGGVGALAWLKADQPVFRWDDPLPALAELAGALRRAAARVRRSSR